MDAMEPLESLTRSEAILEYWIMCTEAGGRRPDDEAICSKAMDIHRRIEGGHFDADRFWLMDYDRRRTHYDRHSIDHRVELLITSDVATVPEEITDSAVDTCRSCLTVRPAFCSVFDYSVDGMLDAVCSMKISKSDLHTKSICHVCYNELKAAYRFRKRCKISQEILRKGDTSAEFIEENEELDDVVKNDDITLLETDCKDLIFNSQSHVDEDSSASDLLINIARSLRKCKSRKCKNVKKTKEETDSGTSNQAYTLKEGSAKGETYISKANGWLTCLVCEYKTKHRTTIRRHVLIHTKEEPFACSHCPRTFSRSHHLKDHLMTHNGEKPYLCESCDYRCRTKQNLRTHQRNKHSDLRNFVCDTCGHAAKTRSALVMHVKMHLGLRDFTCTDCPFTSLTLANLQNHRMLHHTGERPFACPHCPRRCINAAYLKSHMRMHSSIKKFACDICPYTGHTGYRLKMHMRCHTGERPYNCDLCDYKITKKKLFVDHRKIVHGLTQV